MTPDRERGIRVRRRKRAPDQRLPVTMRPQPGFYRVRLVKGGPWLPAALWWEPQTDPAGYVLDRAHWLVGHIGADRVEDRGNGRHIPRWPWHPISEDEYRRMMQRHVAEPREAVDLATAPLPF